MARRLSSLIVLVLLSAPRLALAQAAEAAHPWTYEGAKGPRHWGDLKPEYAACKTGKHQSPIDIRDAKAADLPAIEFFYSAQPFRIIDNGHSVQVNVDPGSFISVNGRRFDLNQFHFHHPSEEKVQGHSFPLVAHLVHRDADAKLAVVRCSSRRGARTRSSRRCGRTCPRTWARSTRPRACWWT